MTFSTPENPRSASRRFVVAAFSFATAVSVTFATTFLSPLTAQTPEAPAALQGEVEANPSEPTRPPIIDVHLHAMDLWALPGAEASDVFRPVWPDAIGRAIETVEGAPFLTDEQRRDIMCRNAMRFFRFDQTVCD